MKDPSRAQPYTAAIVDRCLITYWGGRVTVESVHELAQDVDRAVARQGRSILCLGIISQHSPLVGKAERAELERLFNDSASRFHAAAQVIEGKGLRASAVLSVVTAIGLIRRRSYPWKAFHEVPEAITWLLAQDPTARPGAQQRIVQTAQELCAGDATQASAVRA